MKWLWHGKKRYAALGPNVGTDAMEGDTAYACGKYKASEFLYITRGYPAQPRDNYLPSEVVAFRLM